MTISPAVRNVAIIAVIAAMVAILPGGGTGANVVLTGLRSEEHTSELQSQ